MNKLVVNNHSYDEQYRLNNINNIENNPIRSLGELYDLLETILCDIFDYIFRNALGQMNTYKYVNVGGKSLNMFIKEKYIKKSFDFDLHIFEGNEYDLNLFGFKLAENVNNIVNNLTYRKYIINLLKRYKLITDAETSHYTNNILFYFGERVKNNFSINGVFAHFIFKQDLFVNGIKYSNMNNSTNNEIYYPIADIDLERNVNLGLIINDNRYFFASYDGVRYANFIVALHNLIKYSTMPGYKIKKLYNKLKQLTNMQTYSCYCLNKFTNLNNILSNLQINTTITAIPNKPYDNLYINNKNIYQMNRPIIDIINDFITVYNNERHNNLNVCLNSLVLNNNGQNTNKIFIDGITMTEINIILGELEHKVAQIDGTDGYILYFTGVGYVSLNSMNEYNHLGINNPVINYTANNNSIVITFSNGGNININVNEQIDSLDKINRINNTIYNRIKQIKNSDVYINNLINIKDEFYVYRLQNFSCFNSPTGDIFTISNIKVGNVIFMPKFLSTSFTTNYQYDQFCGINTFMFRIRIRKSSENWIFLNKYSLVPTESELLINKNCFFVCTSKDILPIKLGNNLRDIYILDVILCDTLEEAVNISVDDVVTLLNVHDDTINAANNATTQTIVRDITNVSNDVIRRLPNVITQNNNKKIIKTCTNPKILFYENHKRDDGDDGNLGNSDLLIVDLLQYINVFRAIYKSNSFVKQILSNPTVSFFTIEYNNPQINMPNTPDTRPIIIDNRTRHSKEKDISHRDSIIQQNTSSNLIQSNNLREQQIAVMAGGTNYTNSTSYNKYLKYKQKYTQLKLK